MAFKPRPKGELRLNVALRRFVSWVGAARAQKPLRSKVRRSRPRSFAAALLLPPTSCRTVLDVARSRLARSSASGPPATAAARVAAAPIRRAQQLDVDPPSAERRSPLRSGSAARARCPGSRARGAAPAPPREIGGTSIRLAAAELLDEMAHQVRDVLAPLAQRRQLELDALEAVVEVLAEPSLGDQRLEVAVGRGHQRARRPGSARSPPTRTTSRSCRARSSFTCSAGGMSPISSRKSVPPSASSNLPRRAGDAGRDPALDAEQLALEQRLGQRAAVERDERAARGPRGGGGAWRSAPCRCRSRRAAGPRRRVARRARRARARGASPARGRRSRGRRPRAASWSAQDLVLLLQPLALRLEALDLPRAVERHAGERRHRVEEAPVVGAELGARAAALLLVEQRQVAEEDAAVGERHRHQLAVARPASSPSRRRERRALRQQLAPERLGRAGRRPAARPPASPPRRRRRLPRGRRRASPPPPPPGRAPGRPAPAAPRAAPARCARAWSATARS